ncbi:DUF3494 domain-containing protein [Candidatus Micrarchaeota archaeon]|nr:DUF3494 domain-containing protein [Candidatus Micrarchaeota archaeon]
MEFKNVLSLFVLGILLSSVVSAAGPAAVNLGSAGSFVILAKSGISTTGTTAITGNIGVSPIDHTAITGFGLIADSSNRFSTSSLVNGSVYASNFAPPTPSAMTTAVSDMETAYTDAAGRTLPDFTELGAGNIGGMTLVPGLYKWGTGVTIPTDVTLSGNSTDVWIFQIAQTLDIASGKQVILSGGAQAQNIFWQVGDQTTIGTTAVFNGNILDQTAIVLNTGATLNGRALSQTAVTLDANSVNAPGGVTTIVKTNGSCSIQVLNASVNYPYTFNVTASCNDPTAVLYMNGTATNASSLNTTPLGVGSYNLTINITDTANYAFASNSTMVNVSRGTPTLSLNSSANWSIGFTTATNVSAIGCPAVGASDLTCTISIDGVDAGVGSKIINMTHAVGTYLIRVNSSAGANWTAASSDPTNLTINRASMTLNLFIDGFQLNKAMGIGNQSVISGSKPLAEGTLALKINGSQVATGASVSNTSTYVVAARYNLTLEFNQTQNFSAGSNTQYLVVFNFTPNASQWIADSGITLVNGTIIEVLFLNTSSAQNLTIDPSVSGSKPVFLNYSLVSEANGGATIVRFGAAFSMNRNTSSGMYYVQIPANTTISGNGWDGTLSAPTLMAASSVAITPPSGFLSTTSLVLSMGSSMALTFDKGVRILISGEAGKRVGYSRNGTSFTEITATCASDSQAVGDALAAGADCTMNAGADLVIWTKHFTEFATYTLTPTPSSSGGSGGGTGATPSSSPTATSNVQSTPSPSSATGGPGFPSTPRPSAQPSSTGVTPTVTPRPSTNTGGIGPDASANPSAQASATVVPASFTGLVTDTAANPLAIGIGLVVLGALGYVVFLRKP